MKRRAALFAAAALVTGCSSPPPDADCGDVVAYYARCEPSLTACMLEDDRTFCSHEQAYYRPDVVTGLAACARTTTSCAGTSGTALDDCRLAVLRAAPVTDAWRNVAAVSCERCPGLTTSADCVALQTGPDAPDFALAVRAGRDDLLARIQACVMDVDGGVLGCNAIRDCYGTFVPEFRSLPPPSACSRDGG